MPAPITYRSNRGQRPFTSIFPPHFLGEPKPDVAPPDLSHDGSILCLQYDKTTLVTGSSDTTLILWDIVGDEYIPRYRLRHHTAGVLDVCFDSRYIVSCSKDTSVCLWDRKTGDLLRVLTGHHGPVNAVQLRGDLIVSASGDGMAKLWNLASSHCVKEFPSENRGLAVKLRTFPPNLFLRSANSSLVCGVQ